MRCLFFGFSFLLAACGGPTSAQSVLPNQPAIAEENTNGARVLVGWSIAKTTALDMTERQLPDNRIFDGSELWRIELSDSVTDLAAQNAFSQAGMKNPKIIASTQLNSDASDVLDSHPDAQGHAVMVEGRLSDELAYGISVSIYGSLNGANRTTGVHAFMAPKDKFEALGGFSIVAAKWFQASAAPDEDMVIEGALAPQAATDRMAQFFNAWVEQYVIPMMGLSMQMQLQSIERMSSWNNAMNACAGDPSCVIQQDGLGGWSATTK